MARHKKNTVDYFPHFAICGKTIFTLESIYGNDGYAFWFKLLELLCISDGHCYRTDNPADWLFLVSKTRVTEEKATDILKTLASLDAISAGHFEKGMIWCDKLVENLEPVYAKRKKETPTPPELLDHKPELAGVSVTETRQSKVEYSREKESKTTPLPPKGGQHGKRFTKPTAEEVEAYCRERGNGISGQEFVDANDATSVVKKDNKPLSKVTDTIDKKDTSQKIKYKESRKPSWKPERPDWFPEKDWDDLLAHRRAKKATNSERAMNILLEEFKKAKDAGLSIGGCVDLMVIKEWRGFKADWAINQTPKEKPYDPFAGAI